MKEIFIQSLTRCAKSEDFIPSFYDRFLSMSDEIREKFKDTDFAQQNRMLLRSLNLAATATAGEPRALQDLRERAESHDRHHFNIEPRFYEFWRSAIIETAKEFDDEWDDQIEEVWHRILGHVIHHMMKRY